MKEEGRATPINQHLQANAAPVAPLKIMPIQTYSNPVALFFALKPESGPALFPRTGTFPTICIATHCIKS
jgi:hypothetical protein